MKEGGLDGKKRERRKWYNSILISKIKIKDNVKDYHEKFGVQIRRGYINKENTSIHVLLHLCTK